MQKIISRKGYVDAHALKKLAKKIDFNLERSSDETPVKAKVKVRGGDRETKTSTRNRFKKGKVQFLDCGNKQESKDSPSDITIYQPTIKLKPSLKRKSTSSEDEADMDVDCFDSSNEIDYLDHNSHQMITDNFYCRYEEAL